MGNRALDLTGQRFGRLVAIRPVGKDNNNSILWLCKCDCGNEKAINASSLKRNITKSCGCLHIEATKKSNTKHGLRHSRLYGIYTNMKSRCYNPKTPKYKNYGARGIKICDEWLTSFKSFYGWAITNGYSQDLTIDRIDNDGNYEPFNCKWSTNQEQANNTRNNHIIEYNGEKMALCEAARKYNIEAGTLERRLKCGWSIEEALLKKVQKQNREEQKEEQNESSL